MKSIQAEVSHRLSTGQDFVLAEISETIKHQRSLIDELAEVRLRFRKAAEEALRRKSLAEGQIREA